MKIIGIAGGTGSGKTTVVKRIVEALPPHYVAVVPLDSYYNDTSHMTEEERRAINFDHPDAFDWKLLVQHVKLLRDGVAVEQPTYSYLKSNREKATVHVEPKPVIIIEGIMALLNKHSARLCGERKNCGDGDRSLSEGAQTDARAVYRTDEEICRLDNSAWR